MAIGFGSRVRPDCEPGRGGGDYFPAKSFSTDGQDGSAFEKRYAAWLADMGEGSLSCGAGSDETYRFLLIEPYQRPPAMVRVSRRGDQYRVVAVMTDNELPNPSQSLNSRLERTISTEEWQTIAPAVRELDLWHTPTAAIPMPGEPFMVGGSTWVLEGRLHDAYHIIARRIRPRDVRADNRAVANVLRAMWMVTGRDLPIELRPSQ